MADRAHSKVELLLSQPTLSGAHHQDTVQRLEDKVEKTIPSIKMVGCAELTELIHRVRTQLLELAQRVNDEAAPTHTPDIKAHAVDPPRTPVTTKLETLMPRFDGNMLHWDQFWTQFEQILSLHTCLSDYQKSGLLLKAMDDLKAADIINRGLEEQESFQGIVDRLREIYDSKRDVFYYYTEQFLSKETFAYTRMDLWRLKKHIKAFTNGQKVCKTDTLSQFVVSYVESWLSPKFREEWYIHTADYDVTPETDTLLFSCLVLWTKCCCYIFPCVITWFKAEYIVS